MQFPSQPVASRQQEPHPRLVETVVRHRDHLWQKPLSTHSRPVFDALRQQVEDWRGPLVLDTGCGTGMSTAVLARRHPDCLVIGVDKSESRLARSLEVPRNVLLVRLDLEDFWILACEARWQFARQCFFYPNPWPKPEQRLRRWPFHPVLPLALACGGIWEVRTNWKIYAQEFALAFGVLSGRTRPVEQWLPQEPETLFEKKYLDSGHTLWRWVSEPESTQGPLPLQD